MEKKYKRGITIGTFDMFHIGHLNLVKQAKAMCDYLIVSIHSDDYVLKCKHRPTIYSYEDRAAIMAAIKYVDEVVCNEAPIDIHQWEKYHFDAIFIGDDWAGTPGWKKVEDILSSVGSKVEYLHYTGGISTTLIRDKIINTSNSKFEGNKDLTLNR